MKNWFRAVQPKVCVLQVAWSASVVHGTWGVWREQAAQWELGQRAESRAADKTGSRKQSGGLSRGKGLNRHSGRRVAEDGGVGLVCATHAKNGSHWTSPLPRTKTFETRFNFGEKRRPATYYKNCSIQRKV